MADVRVSDADRDRVVAQLQQHVADGRLTLEEFGDRVSGALRSVTRRDLDEVLDDLPALPSSGATSPGKAAGRTRRWFVGIMSGAGAKGRWRTGSSVTAVAIMGGCHLDFRRAVIEGPEVVVTAFALMGGIEIIVPEGVEVSLTGLPIMGGKDLHIADVPVVPGTPRIVVRAFPIMGGVGVRSKRDKRGEPAVESSPAPAMPPVPPTVPAPAVGPVPTGVPVAVPDQPEAPAAGPPIDGTVTIMFSDVYGFSELTERLGDVATQQLLAEHNRVIRSEVDRHGGQVVKANGDGFMVVFGSAARALRCASSVQQVMQHGITTPDGGRLQVHIGLHAGEVVRDGDDLIGQAVNLASRLSDVAGPDEVLVSSLTRELAAGSREFAFGPPREVELKGLGPRAAFPLDWHAASTV